MAGIWQHRDVDELDFYRLCEAHEMLDAKYENARRANEAFRNS